MERRMPCSRDYYVIFLFILLFCFCDSARLCGHLVPIGVAIPTAAWICPQWCLMLSRTNPTSWEVLLCLFRERTVSMRIPTKLSTLQRDGTILSLILRSVPQDWSPRLCLHGWREACNLSIPRRQRPQGNETVPFRSTIDYSLTWWRTIAASFHGKPMGKFQSLNCKSIVRWSLLLMMLLFLPHLILGAILGVVQYWGVTLAKVLEFYLWSQ